MSYLHNTFLGVLAGNGKGVFIYVVDYVIQAIFRSV